MKCIWIIPVVTMMSVLLVRPCLAEAAADEDDVYGERTVAAAMQPPGISLSFTEKGVNRLGDRAAIGLIRLLGRRSLDRAQIEKALTILRAAFGAPRIISRAPDREPKATLFLLDCLKNMPTSRGLESDIARTRDSVMHAAKGTSNEMKANH